MAPFHVLFPTFSACRMKIPPMAQTFSESTNGNYVRGQSVLVNRRRLAYYLCMIEQTYRYIMALDGVRRMQKSQDTEIEDHV